MVKHRLDGPAIEWGNGDKLWYQHGLFHREDGPAIDTKNSKQWYLNGLLHRDNGPAIEVAGGTKQWFRYGKECISSKRI